MGSMRHLAAIGGSSSLTQRAQSAGIARWRWGTVGFAPRGADPPRVSAKPQARALIPSLAARPLTARFRPRLRAMNRRPAHPRTAPTHAETTATRATAGPPTASATAGQSTAHATRRLLSAGAAAVTLATSGCSTDTTPTPGPTTPARAEATVTLPDGAATTSTTRPVDVLADMPAPARERSDAGVEAFVRYFYDSANALAMNPRTGEIAKLCDTAVPLCAQYEGALSSYLEQGLVQERPIFLVTLNEASKAAGIDPDAHLVTTMIDRPEQILMRNNGNTATTFPDKGIGSQVVHVTWRDGRWFITRVEEL